MNFIEFAVLILALALSFLALVHIREMCILIKISALAFVAGAEYVLRDDFLPLPQMIVLWRILGLGLVAIIMVTLWPLIAKKICRT